MPINKDSISVTLLVPKTLLDDVDALAEQANETSPGRIVKRSEVLRDVLIVGIRERQRKRGVSRGEASGSGSPKVKREA
jgi:hypothetical protein